MELSLSDVCEKISNTNLRTNNKTELYRNASELFDSCQIGEITDDLPLTSQSVKNIQTDLTARDEELKVSASHLFLSLVHLSKTITPQLSQRPDCWTIPIKSFLSDAGYLVQTCFPLLGSTNIVSQQKSLSIVMQYIDQIKSWSVQTNEEAQMLLTHLVEMCVLPRLENMLGEPERQEVLAMEIWQQLIHSIGNYIPIIKHELINRLLKLIEFCFKNTREGVQLCAYKSWSILIRTFSLHPTFLVKKLRLFNVPLLSSAVKQDHRYAAVDVERAKTWCQLILSLMPELQDHANSVCTPFFLFCIGLDPKLTLSRKFNETFETHFNSLTNSRNSSDSLQESLPIHFTQDAQPTVSTVLSSIENDANFMTLLSSLNNTQHLPKKAVLDPESMFDWRKQLCYQGIKSLAQFLNITQPCNQSYTDTNTDKNNINVRNAWILDNHKVLLTLIGLSVHHFDPSEGAILSECFGNITHIMTSAESGVNSADLLYPSLVICQTAVSRKHSIHTVISLIESVYNSIPGQLSLPLSDSTNSATALLFIEILLDHHMLNSGDVPDSFFNLYQQLLYCSNIGSRDVREYQHFLAKLETPHNDVSMLWRSWKLTAEALLVNIQSSNGVKQEDSTPVSTYSYTLSFLLTQTINPPNSISLVKECACVWKKLATNILKLISEVCSSDGNLFVNSICQRIDSVITEPQLQNTDYFFFITLLLDDLVSLLDLNHSVVYTGIDTIISPFKLPTTPFLVSSDKLGNITSCVLAISRFLNYGYFSEIPDSINGSTDVIIEHIAASQSISNIIKTSIYLFSRLDNTLLIQNVLACLSTPLGLYFELFYSSSSISSIKSSSEIELFTSLMDKLWAAIKSTILTNFESYNTQLLLILCPILIPLFHTTDRSIVSSASEFFSRTFIGCTEDSDFPESLKTILYSLETLDIVESQVSEQPDSSLTAKLRKIQGVRKMDARDEISSPTKRVKLSSDETLNSNKVKLVSNESSTFNSDIQIISSNDTTIGPMDLALSNPIPCEEDPLSLLENVITLFDDRDNNINDSITISPTHVAPNTPDTPGHNTSIRLKTQLKSNSEQKLKQTKLKLKGNWPVSPNEKEKKAFFKLELTPIRLEEFPKSSPTHNTVNRKLQFPPDNYEQETVSKDCPDVQILDLDFEPVHDTTTTSLDKPAVDTKQLDLDSVEEFIKNIPLSDIISPDELETKYNIFPTHSINDVSVSDGTSSLMTLSSSSVTQSLTPPITQPEPEIPVNADSEADSLLAFNNCIQTDNESVPINLELFDAVDVEPMEIDEGKAKLEQEQANNISADSIATKDDVMNTSALMKDFSPEASTTLQSSNQFNTPKQSILKKHTIFSPSPIDKKVSFANPIQKTHAISVSPRTRKLRTQKQSPTSKLMSATTSIAIRRATRLGTTGVSTNPEDPICSALLECTEPVDALVPFLTSQSVSRGITGLLKAKKIETIGDLAVLNEREAETLPIQPPKLQTLRTAFSKYQVTQFGSPGDLTRQSNNPLFFPRPPVEEQGAGEEEKTENDQDQVVPFQVLEATDFTNNNNTDSIAVDIPQCPVDIDEGDSPTAPERTSTFVQTESITSSALVNELAEKLPGELESYSQEKLNLILNSLCQLIPSIAGQFTTK
ncbi:Telomere-associated protein RIF1-like isoform X1 [Oopsacas minuta]|uniref:Telomere-associated protein RIF1-like isoform X1 n=1 Tax=Oopsacas minuta TaxID=111878 RepID=A0AAV7JRV8_9METZ|nr:Telomere-associated protein RIF1-like isoform X1 [Oopsacas minuta]